MVPFSDPAHESCAAPHLLATLATTIPPGTSHRLTAFDRWDTGLKQRSLQRPPRPPCEECDLGGADAGGPSRCTAECKILLDL